MWRSSSGSTRPGRKAEDVARWVYGIAAKRSDASFEVVDIAAFDLPLLDEARSSLDGPVRTAAHESLGREDRGLSMRSCSSRRSTTIRRPARSRTRSIISFREWNDKAARVCRLRRASVERVPSSSCDWSWARSRLPTSRAQVALSLFTDFENFSTLKPGPHQEAAVNAMLNDLDPRGVGRCRPMRLQSSERGAL